jgi:hypothetical protein
MFEVLKYSLEVPKYSRDVLRYLFEVPRYSLGVLKYSLEVPKYSRDVLKYLLEVPKYSQDVLKYSRDVPKYSLDVLKYPPLLMKYPFDGFWYFFSEMEVSNGREQKKYPPIKRCGRVLLEIDDHLLLSIKPKIFHYPLKTIFQGEVLYITIPGKSRD